MSKKDSTSTQSVQVPPDVLARYNAVNASAQQAASTPFKVYSTDPGKFVAQLTDTQNAGVSNTNRYAETAQPQYEQAYNNLTAGQGQGLGYFNTANSDLAGALSQGQRYITAATGDVSNALNVGGQYAGLSQGALAGANASSSPLLGAAGADYTQAFNSAQPLNAQAGQAYAGAYAGAQPYNAGATSYTLAGGQAVDPNQLNVGQYLSPYLSTVLGSTSALINQNNQQQQAGQLGNAIKSGAFGGDRAGIAAATLAGQQNLAAGNIYSGILNQGYNTALGAAQQQQGVQLGAQQANRAALQQTGQSLLGIGAQDYTQGMGYGSAQQGLGQQLYAQGMGLGSAQQGLAGQVFGQGLASSQQEAALGQQQYGQQMGASSQLGNLGQEAFGQGLAGSQQRAAIGQDVYNTMANTAAQEAAIAGQRQTSALQGAQAQLAAGQVQQQTNQAGLTALYNQFLQQQSYPFQTQQFLANIAEGTGALSGSTTTTTQPGGFFSDRRLKDDVEKIGETFDGQPIYRYRYKGDPRTQIGLMAQDVERKHPDAVGLAAGYKTVNYDEATQDAAKRGHFREGGLASANDNRDGYLDGGLATGTYGGYMPDLLAEQQQMYGPYAGAGLYGSGVSGSPRGGSSYVPAPSLPVGHLMVAGAAPDRPPSAFDQAKKIGQAASAIGNAAHSDTAKKLMSMFHQSGPVSSHAVSIDKVEPEGLGSGNLNSDLPDTAFARGGLARGHYAMGGDAPYASPGLGIDIPDETPKDLSLATPGQPPGKGKSGLSDITDAAKTAAEVAKVAAMFMARGGAADGPVIDPERPDDDPADADKRASILRLVREVMNPQSQDDGPEVEAAPGVSAAPEARIAAPAPALDIEKPEVGERPASNLKGLPSDIGNTLKLIAKAEGTGKNPNSSAKGLYQITDPTFVGAFRQMFPDKASGMSKTDILKLRETPEGEQLSGQMGPWLAKQNAEALDRAGLPVTPPSLYLAHFLGPEGAKKVLTARPDTPLSDLISPLAISENRSVMAGKTASDLQDWAANRLQQVNRSEYRKGGRVGKADGGELSDDTIQMADPERGPPLSGQVDRTLPTESVASPEHAGFLSSLKKPEVFIPILSAISAMGTAPTRSFGVALASGLGAGAQAYQGQRKFELEQQRVAQQGQEVQAYANAMGLKPQEVQISRYQAQTQRLNAQIEGLGHALQIFDANYSQVPDVGADGYPMYVNRLSGQRITQSQYAQERSRYLQTALGGIGGDVQSPISAAQGLVAPGAGGAVAVPSVPGPDSAGGPGPRLPGVGGGVPAVRGPEPGVPPGPGGGGGALWAPLPQPAPQGQLGPHAKVADKVQAGAYLRPPVPLPQIDPSQLADNSNPNLLMQQGRALQQSGTTPEIRAQGQALIERAQNIMAGKEVPLGRDGQPFMGYAKLAQANAAAGAMTQGYAQQKEQINSGAQDFSQQYPLNTQILNSLNRIYSTNEPGRATGEWANLIGIVKSTPGLKGLITPAMQKELDSYDEGKKDSARQAIAQAVAADMASKAPAAALHTAGLTVPDPALGAGARYNLVAQMLALQQRTKDFYKDWSKYKDNVMDVSSFGTDWASEHPIGAYEKWAYDRIVPFAGMSKQEMEAHPRHPKTPQDVEALQNLGRPGIPFVIPYGPRAGQIGYTQ